MPVAAATLVDELRAIADPVAHPNRHYRGDGGVLGVRMGTLFEITKRYAAMPLGELEGLLDERPYELRLAAFCVMDFAVRVRGVDDGRREEMFELYLRRHDAIDSWDMIDRAAPRVVGGWLAHRSRAVLFDLAASSDPLRRRTAMTAPLFYTRSADAAGLVDLYALAGLLLEDTDPLVSKPVGIALRHAGAVDPDGVRAFLQAHADRVPPSIRRAAQEKLTH